MGAARSDDKRKEIVGDITPGLLSSIYADTSLSSDAQQGKITQVETLSATALRKSLPPAQPGAQPVQVDQETAESALSQLAAMNRATEIPSLDTAAKALVGITALLTGLFTGIGFTTGDFVRMIRDFRGPGIAFLILVSVALLLGTFAFLINAYRSQWNLRFEQFAIYIGIACAATAFIFASWGIAEGASAGPTRPAIAASFDTSSNKPVLKVTANSSDVPRTEHLTATVWGETDKGWTLLGHVAVGPDHNGAAATSMTVNNVSSYTLITASARLSSTDDSVDKAPTNGCAPNVSCVRLVGLTPAS
jgi:hypothetical protein